MHNLALAFLTSLGVAVVATVGAAQAAGAGGCSSPASAQSEPVEAPSNQSASLEADGAARD